jgi:hypothetical protein
MPVTRMVIVMYNAVPLVNSITTSAAEEVAISALQGFTHQGLGAECMPADSGCKYIAHCKRPASPDVVNILL